MAITDTIFQLVKWMVIMFFVLTGFALAFIPMEQWHLERLHKIPPIMFISEFSPTILIAGILAIGIVALKKYLD